MKSACAFLMTIALLGLVFGGGRTALLVHAHHTLVAMR